MRHYVLLYLAIVSFTAASRSKASENWSHHGTKEGITVFVSEMTGSDIPVVKAVTVVDASVEEVWRYITGPRETATGLKQRVVLGSCGSSCEYVYVRFGHPLIDDRHYVVKLEDSIKNQGDGTAYSRHWVKTRDKSTLANNAIEVVEISGRWTLEPIDKGRRTKLTYKNHMDPGGNLSGYIFRSGFIKSAYSILTELRKNI